MPKKYLLLISLLCISLAYAEPYKCIDPKGKIIYQQLPCTETPSTPMQLSKQTLSIAPQLTHTPSKRRRPTKQRTRKGSKENNKINKINEALNKNQTRQAKICWQLQEQIALLEAELMVYRYDFNLQQQLKMAKFGFVRSCK